MIGEAPGPPSPLTRNLNGYRIQSTYSCKISNNDDVQHTNHRAFCDHASIDDDVGNVFAPDCRRDIGVTKNRNR